MRTPAPLVRQWDRLPEAVRTVVRDEAAAMGRELRTLRGPADIRRLLRDNEALERVAEPLAPALDRIVALVARGTMPLTPAAGGVAVATTGALSAAASSALEVCAALGVEAPPAAAAAAGGAGAVAVAAQLVEFYLIACVTWKQLRDSGCDDPATLRRVLIETYLGPEPTVEGELRAGGLEVLARALVRRLLPRLAPVAGIPAAGVAAWRDLKRAQAAVERALRASPAPALSSSPPPLPPPGGD